MSLFHCIWVNVSKRWDQSKNEIKKMVTMKHHELCRSFMHGTSHLNWMRGDGIHIEKIHEYIYLQIYWFSPIYIYIHLFIQ